MEKFLEVLGIIAGCLLFLVISIGMTVISAYIFWWVWESSFKGN